MHFMKALEKKYILKQSIIYLLSRATIAHSGKLFNVEWLQNQFTAIIKRPFLFLQNTCDTGLF